MTKLRGNAEHEGEAMIDHESAAMIRENGLYMRGVSAISGKNTSVLSLASCFSREFCQNSSGRKFLQGLRIMRLTRSLAQGFAIFALTMVMTVEQTPWQSNKSHGSRTNAMTVELRLIAV